MAVCVLGSINLDIVLSVDSLPRPGETLLGRGIETFPGGKGANQAVAAARAGADVRLIGAVGRDGAGNGLLEGLAAAGVDLEQVDRIDDAPTGTAHICVAADGQNTIVVLSGANASPSAASIRPEALAGCEVFLCQFETPISALQALLKSGPARAGTRIVNAAPAVPEGAALFPLADILVVNETELARYAGLAADPATPDEAARAARRLLGRPGQTVIVTLGPDGAIAVTDEEVFAVPGRPAHVVDTTGAGDCFCGVLAAWLSFGLGLPAAMAAANAAGALSVGRAGATTSMPTRAELDAALGA